MRRELNKIRQDLKQVLAGLAQFQEQYKTELEQLRVKDDSWKDPGTVVCWMANRSGENFLKQIDKLLDTVPKERRGKKVKNEQTMPLRLSAKVRVGRPRRENT